MTGSKQWYLSKGILGGIASMLAGIGMVFGVEIDAEAFATTLANLIGPLASVVGGILAVYGRKTARQRIE